MLVYFTVSNFRSIKDELTLSMSAGRFKSASSNRSCETGFAQFPCLLRSAAIYGANASGKSTIVKALDFLQDFVRDSFRDEVNSSISRVIPYKFDDKFSVGPSNFEIAFVQEDNFYTFGFSVDHEMIREEWLHVKSKEGRVREVYSRVWTELGYEWHFSPFFKSRRKASGWKESTRPDALFLSTAISLNSEELKPVYDWITLRLRVLSGHDSVGNVVTSKHVIENGVDDEFLTLLKSADSSILGVVVKARPIEESEAFSMFSEEFRSQLIEGIKDIVDYDVQFEHMGINGEKVLLDFGEESDGTKVIYRYAGPIVQSTTHDFVLVVDELDRSLHPLLLQGIIREFSDPPDSESRAQLVFTTHDSALLASDVLARDQIWLTENRVDGGTVLIPLSDYKPRKNEAIQQAYLRGRYGGVPLARRRFIENAE